MDKMEQLIVGVDMANATFQAELVLEEKKRKRREFANTNDGYLQFVAWCESFSTAGIIVCMEATGRYYWRFAKFLYAAGHDVRIANGKRIRKFAEAIGLLNKTDKADAHAIAEYLLKHGAKTCPWQPPSTTRVALADIRCHVNGLQKALRQFENRSGSGIETDFVLDSIASVVCKLKQELETALRHAATLIAEDEQLQADKHTLEEQIGIGPATSTVLLTRIDFRAFRSGRQVGRFAGLTPRRERSGTSIDRNLPISKEGAADVRAALWMAAGSAMQHDPDLRAWADRMRSRNKHPGVIRTAIMRKLLVRCWALINHGTSYVPGHIPKQFQTTA